MRVGKIQLTQHALSPRWSCAIFQFFIEKFSRARCGAKLYLLPTLMIEVWPELQGLLTALKTRAEKLPDGGGPKGQLISKCLFGVIVWTKKTNETLLYQLC